MEALAELALSADKHHYWVFCNVRWEEMTLKAFQGRAGDAIDFEVRCSLLCVKCGVRQLDVQLRAVHFIFCWIIICRACVVKNKIS